MRTRLTILGILLGGILGWTSLPVQGEELKSYRLVIKDNQFRPQVIEIPAGKRIKLIIENRGDQPAEFESFDLNREQLVRAQSEAVIYIGPLEAGSYLFFDDFYPESTGKIIARKTAALHP